MGTGIQYYLTVKIIQNIESSNLYPEECSDSEKRNLFRINAIIIYPKFSFIQQKTIWIPILITMNPS